MAITRERSNIVFQRLERGLIKLSTKATVENVHRFRTCTRRLQTLLRELSPKRNRNQKKLLRLLGELRKRAGKVRDLDVQLAALRSLRVAQEPRRKTQLMSGLIEHRASAEGKLRKALNKKSLREARKRLKRASKDFNPEKALDALAVARHILAEIADPEGELTEDVLHLYRIYGKRARYAAEFSPKTAEAIHFIAELKRMQDALGDWRDWFTLTQSARQQVGEARESALVAELQNVTGAKFRQAVTVLSQVRGKTAPGSQVPAPVPARSQDKIAPLVISAA